jgi:hypothetical protein
MCPGVFVKQDMCPCFAATGWCVDAGDGFADGPESGPGDLELAVSCWWRAAALQALSAYVMGIMGKGLAEDAAQQVCLGLAGCSLVDNTYALKRSGCAWACMARCGPVISPPCCGTAVVFTTALCLL